eukprot:scaffold1736_cov127-Cylindrotheca_fusiformis.AAC.58
MVSPLVRRNLPPPAVEGRQSNGAAQRYPSPIHRRSIIADGHKSPLGMTIVSPASSIASVSHMGGMPSPAVKETTGSTTSNTLDTTVNSSRRANYQRAFANSASILRSPLPPSSASSSKHTQRSSHSKSNSENRDPTEAEVKVLHARFNAIQMGLGSIDQERALLVEKAKKLEKEKEDLEQQVQLRDNEIIALVKRCASQEERMREYSKVRAENRELTTELQNVLHKLETTKHESDRLHDLRQQLNRSENAREELQKRLEWVQKEHDSIAATLSDCLENIRNVTEEKERMEDERRRERKRAEMEIEKQRLSIRQLSQSFQLDIETKQKRIDQMEVILHQNKLSDATSTMSSASGSVKQVISNYESQIYDMQRVLDHHAIDKARTGDIQDARLTKTVEKYEQIIAEMKNQLDRQERDRQASAEYERQISSLKQQLNTSYDEKESKVAQLHREIERKEESSQQVISELKNQLDQRERDRQKHSEYELEIADLKQQLIVSSEENESRVAQLQKEIEQKEASSQQIISDLKNQINRQERDRQESSEYERQVASLKQQLMVSSTEKESQVAQLHMEIEQKEESNKTTLNETVERYERKVAKLEDELDRQAEEVKRKEESNKKFSDLKNEMENMMKQVMAEHETKVARMQSQIDKQVIDRESKNDRIDKKFKAMKAKLEEKNTQMSELESEFSEQMQQLMNNQVALDKTEEEKKILESRIKSLEQIESEHGALVQYAEIMESNVADLTAENGILMVEKETLSEEKATLQDRLHDLECSVSELREKHSAQFGELKGKLEAEKKQLMGQVEAGRERLTSTEEELQQRNALILKIENELNESRTENAKLESQLITKQKEQQLACAQLEASLTDARNQIAGMEDKLEWERTIQTQQSDASEEIESLSRALEKETKRATSSEEKCAQIKEELNVLIGELSDRDHELEKMVDLEKYNSILSQLAEAESAAEKMKEDLKQETEKSTRLSEELKGFGDLRDMKEKLELAKEQLEVQLATEENKTKRLEQKIDSLLSSSQDMVAELDKASSRLEEEAEGWAKKEEAWEETRIALEEHCDALESKVASAHEEISLLEEEIERRDQRIASLVSEVENLENNEHEEEFLESERQRLLLEGQLADVRRQVKEAAQNLEQKVNRIERLHEELSKAQTTLEEKDGILEKAESRCSELAAKVESLETLLSTREESLMKIDEDLDTTINEIAEKEAEIFAMKQAIDAKDAEINSVMKEMKQQKENSAQLQEQLSNAETKNVTYEEVLGKQTDAVSNLKKEVEFTNDSKKQRLLELEKTIRKMRTDLALKDDEIRDLKMVDLKDAEEEISILRLSLQSKQRIEAELAEKEAELTEKQKEIDHLLQKQTKCEHREQAMLNECEKLLKSESHARELLAKKEVEMESILVRELKHGEMNMQKDREVHKQEVLKLKAELDATKEKLKGIEKILKERSALLTEVVDHNKDLEAKMENQHRQLEVLKDELKEARLELESKRDEIVKLRRGHRDREGSLKKQLQEERRNLETAEKSLEKLKRQHPDSTTYKKQINDHKKEIDALQDKVKRQESYMQKKLQKERESNRSTLSPKKSRTSQPTMARTPSVRKRSSGIPSALPASSILSTPSVRAGSRASMLKTPGIGKSPGWRNDLD